MRTPRSILVCTDFSAASDAALREALRWSARLRASAHVLHVVEPPLAAEAVDLRISAEGTLSHRPLDAIDAALARVGHDGAMLGERLVRAGDPAQVVLQAARELAADLIVLGTHGRSGVRRFLLGSLAERIAHVAERPVLLSRAPAAGRLRPHEPSLLAALDLQPASAQSWSYAVDLAEGLGLKAHALHVYAPLLISTTACAELSPHDSLHHAVLRSLQELVDPYRSPSVGKCIAAAGDPRWVIPETAEELGCELVIVGRNASSFARIALGEVHTPVLSRTSCSVLVLNHPPRR